MNLKLVMLAGSLLMSGSADAATWLRYTVIGGGSYSDYTYDYAAEKYTGFSKKGVATLSFSVDLDDHILVSPPDYYSGGGAMRYYNKNLQDYYSAFGTSKTLNFYAFFDEAKARGYDIGLKATILGTSPSNGFAEAISRKGAGGTFTYNTSRGDYETFQEADFDGRVNRVEVHNASGFEDFSISVVAVPEPATWGMMIVGFGMVGGVLRRRRHGNMNWNARYA
jgi:hypothetical protein